MNKPPSHFIWLDALRGIAALAVVIFHYHHFYLADYTDRPNIPSYSQFPYATLLSPIYKHGHYAVELFWIISGFVFAHVYTNKKSTLFDFTVARVARLYPLHFLMLIAVLVTQSISMSELGYWQIYGNNDTRHFLLQVFFASNWITWSRGLSFNGPIWSVSLEIIVYFAFFASLPIIRKFGLLASVIFSIILFTIYYSDVNLPFIRIGVFRCALYFFVGSSIYLAVFRSGYVIHSKASMLGLSAMLIGLGIFGVSDKSEDFILLGVFTQTILAVTWLDTEIGSKARILKPLGDISYSVYLVHVPIQMAVLLVADLAFDGNRSFADNFVVLPIYAFASALLAWFAYQHFERPAGRFVRSMWSNR